MHTEEKRACVLALQGKVIHLSLKLGIEHLSLNREFSTEASFLKKTCFLHITDGADNTGPCWSQKLMAKQHLYYHQQIKHL